MNTGVGAIASKCAVEWRGFLDLSCLHCGTRQWRAALLRFVLKSVSAQKVPLGHFTPP